MKLASGDRYLMLVKYILKVDGIDGTGSEKIHLNGMVIIQLIKIWNKSWIELFIVCNLG